MRTINARRSGRCPAGPQCSNGGTIEIGQLIRDSELVGWIHESDSISRLSVAVYDADQADDLLAEYDRIRAESRQYRTIPTGTYTVRPADERTAAVLSIAVPDFGSFPEGSRVVSMHGSFSVRGRSGLSEGRSWLPFAIIRPGGQIGLYRSMRAILDASEGGLTAEDRHTRAKLTLALKSIRLLIDAGEAELLSYGKAYASAAGHCFVCKHPLYDEESQTRGIGPKCLKNLRQEIASVGPRVYGRAG